MAAAVLLSGCGGGEEPAKQLTDREILTLVYEQAGGENWEEKNKENWCVEEAEIGTWKGVKTNEEGRVVELTLREPKGVIPAEIGGLTELKKLTIYMKNKEKDNDPADCIPASISELVNLEELTLSVGEMAANVPDLSGMTKLQTLDLSFPDATPFPTLEGLTALTSLDLNGFSGNIPEGIYEMKDLKRLYILTSGLKNGLSPKIGELKALEHLQIDHTAGFIGRVQNPDAPLPEEVFSLENVKVVFLRAISNSGTVPPAIGGMKNLTNMTLCNLGLTGELPKEIGDLPKIKKLSIYNNKLTGQIPPEIGKATTLTELWLQQNELSGPIPPAIGNLVNLESLYLANNKLTGKIPVELAKCTKLGKGVFTDFSKNQLDPNVPDAVKKLEYFKKFKF